MSSTEGTIDGSRPVVRSDDALGGKAANSCDVALRLNRIRGAFRCAMMRRWLSVSGVVFLELNNPKPILLII